MRQAIARIMLAAAAMAIAPAVRSMDIVVGQVGPMSGFEANQGRGYGAGMDLLFKHVNKAGGVNGHRFTLVRKDDGGRPEDTVTATKELLAKNKPMVLAGYFGSRNVADLVASGLLGSEKIVLVGYRSWEIGPETPMLYNVRASLRDEINRIIGHFATLGVTRIGLFYEAGPGAANLLQAAQEAAKKSKAQLVAHASYPAGTAKVEAAVDQFMKTTPQAILLTSTGAAAAGFVEEYRTAGGTAQLFMHSGADVEQMAKRLSDEQMKGIAIAQVTPSPYKISSKIAKELNDILASSDKPDVPVSYAMMEGFIAAKVIVEAVRRQGQTPTREGFVAALDSIDNLDLGGYSVNYKSGSHRGSKYVELTIITGAGKIRH